MRRGSSTPSVRWLRPAHLLALAIGAASVAAHVYNETLDPWNINKNQAANDSIDYTTPRRDKYFPSPENWRSLPAYTLLIDKWIDGDPTNNDFFNLTYEYDWRETQIRTGGDAMGLLDERGLDYIQSMGYKMIYMAGTVFLNMPWQSDGYSAIDFTLLDPHFGNLTAWQQFIDGAHARGMYILVDFTVGTMGDLIGFKGHLNTSTPFNTNEYEVVWKDPAYGPWGINHYPDWNFTNVYNESCVYPTFFTDDGSIVDPGLQGCYESSFDHYGDIEAFGVFPDWQRQLAKFASVQDRLREWRTEVLERLKVFSCLSIEALDIDGIRIDKATQVTVDALASWANHTRACAASFNKTNFFIPGEVTGGDTFGAIYYGRGRTPGMRTTYEEALNLTQADNTKFLRDEHLAPLDGSCFHYSVYRQICHYLGVDGQLSVSSDIDQNFVNGWNQMLTSNDFLNQQTGELDPRHMYGVANQDIFRWPVVENGTQKQLAGSFITHLLLPGIPLIWYGEEQGLYIIDSSSSNYVYARQTMVANPAWKRHGCYKMGGDQFHSLGYDAALTGCHDPGVALDHFDPTATTRRAFRNFNHIRANYPAVQDGFMLTSLSNHTHWRVLPFGTVTEFGLWSSTRVPSQKQQGHNGFNTDGQISQAVWMLYTNENVSMSYNIDCSGDSPIKSPYAVNGNGSTTVRNLVYPYEEYTLQNTRESFYQDGNAPYRGCIGSIDLQPYDFKVLVPQAQWLPPIPTLSGFTPGHDERVVLNGDTIQITLEWDEPMDCDSVNRNVKLLFTGDTSHGTPNISFPGECLTLPAQPATELNGVAPSAWRWTATITNAAEGIYKIEIDSVNSQRTPVTSTGVKDHLFFRAGLPSNQFVFPENDYNNSIFHKDGDTYTVNHNAWGADMFRYSANFGQSWSRYQPYEASTTLNATMFKEKNNWWKGEHVMVQYYSKVAGTAAQVVHADSSDYKGFNRRWPQVLLSGPFNQWGYDTGINAHFKTVGDGVWSMPVASTWPNLFHINIWKFDDYYYGDADNDGVLDRYPPNSLTPNYLNMTFPPRPYLAWQVIINDASGHWNVLPLGHEMVSIVAFALLLTIPIITAFAAAAIFRYSFYSIKINKFGTKPAKESSNYFPIVGGAAGHHDKKEGHVSEKHHSVILHEKIKKPDRIIGWPEDPTRRRRVLIATLEYEILDWAVKVKIGGLGVMSTLMGKAMTDVDLIWVVPKVQDIDYPQGDFAEPIEVTIFGEPYLIEVETHQVDNITYVILDSPVFRAQTKSDPYPQRMDDLSSAIFYSTWNQAIAETIRRFEDIDIYHINDYHGALAPLYLLPKIVPVCLSLHNAEFQGLWPLRTKDEMKEVCAAFNISKEVCSKYVQFGNTFNLLHAAASFISHHQKSVGVAGVSDKYGKRSWARYPALWTLRNIDSLPNPDPTDIAALDEQPIAVDKIQVDQVAESKRPEHKRQAQEWAGIKQDPRADLFVFVGRWSKQKGVDLIADVMPGLLEKKSNIQLICVGPVIDLYGRFAAEKLARLMEMYPDRVFSKPEFTTLPPYLFSGADFALIPSRDEPFGLVAVEFGRKGALGVGSRLGGLGLMPGWWFPVESSTATHMLSQLTKTIKLALKSTPQERAILRARSAVQRFPVVEWRQRLEDFQRRSITMSRSVAGEHAWGYEQSTSQSLYASGQNDSSTSLATWNRPGTPDSGSGTSAPNSPRPDSRRVSSGVASLPAGAGSPGAAESTFTGSDYHRRFENRKQNRGSGESFYDEDPNAAAMYQDPLAALEGKPRGRPKFGFGGDDEASSVVSSDRGDQSMIAPSTLAEAGTGHAYDSFLAAANRQFAKTTDGRKQPDPFMERRMSTMSTASSTFAPSRPFSFTSRVSSFDSISSIVDEKNASPLNKAMETFTDSDGEVSQTFVQKLQGLSAANSKGDLCIEKFLMKSEKQFFNEMKKEKLMAMSVRSRDSIHGGGSSHQSTIDGFRPESPQGQYSLSGHSHPEDYYSSSMMYDEHGELEKPMTRTQVLMERSIYGWPLYAIVISIGQLLSATSFQLSLLGGANTQTATDLYIICAIFCAATVFWYTLFRMRPSVYVLAIPWLLFAIAFFMIGLPALYGPFVSPRLWLTKVATWFYAIASSAGFLFFGLNFGEEAGAAAEIWIMRACIVQGLQQIWVSALWYWGYTLVGQNAATYNTPRAIICVTWPLAAVCVAFAYLMFWGLPDYYHQIPPYMPNFIRTLVRRKLVIWFMVSEILRNYWLSPQYGRNWQFLWRVAQVPTWSVVIMIAIFFIGIWGLLMGVLIKYAKVHSWLLPVFAVGLGAPRWAQMFWGISGFGIYVPWGGAAGPYIGTCVWLWLGVLDAIQGVGFGMILLQTLSRLHVCATLAAAQFVGSAVLMIARATAPDKNGPGNVFPNAAFWTPSSGENNPVAHWEFWLCLVCQLIIPFGYFSFFRKEQLVKP
ncbi:hypothetical protein Q8F55_001744 [Vanrija albida]|uniref:alpha-1,3-glucan synthase n=1 Tax=Vanrija albida TaxID=181172 RepID=A0ABR3Q831_9TREE